MTNRKSRIFSCGVTVALGLSLGACSTTPGAENRSLNSVHQPVVERANYALDLGLTSEGSLPVSSQQQLSEWFDAMNLGYGDRISVDNPSGGNVAQTMVEAVASRYGLLVSDVAPVTGGQIAPGAIRVIVTRSSARVLGCPDWSQSYENNIRNSVGSNFGCAMNSNFAAMIADPEDLVKGKTGESAADAAVGLRAIETYRKAEPTGTGKLKESELGGGK